MDLCAAPGSWSQVLAKHMYEPLSPEDKQKVKIIAVDMQGMAPIEGVTQMREDITKESTAEAIINFFEGEKLRLWFVMALQIPRACMTLIVMSKSNWSSPPLALPLIFWRKVARLCRRSIAATKSTRSTLK